MCADLSSQKLMHFNIASIHTEKTMKTSFFPRKRTETILHPCLTIQHPFDCSFAFHFSDASFTPVFIRKHSLPSFPLILSNFLHFPSFHWPVEARAGFCRNLNQRVLPVPKSAASSNSSAAPQLFGKYVSIVLLQSLTDQRLSIPCANYPTFE